MSVSQPSREVTGVIERVIADVPAPRTHEVENPELAASRIVKSAAQRAALLSGSLALPPGPLGFLTVLPDLFLIWQTQRQMISDIFAVHGRSAELSRTHMLYCLFRHAASHVLRDVAVRSGQRYIVQQLSSVALTSAASKIGVVVSKRVIGTATSRWIPLAGAAAVSAYAYWDTLQVGRTAQRLLAKPAMKDITPTAQEA
ncbi:MAG TPA: hypothetical protein VNE58_08700 [Casimicrobiaceae bacterium]|nr:hypothetical protein [Casimicrobiaceae bacterium]